MVLMVSDLWSQEMVDPNRSLAYIRLQLPYFFIKYQQNDMTMRVAFIIK